MAGVIGRVIVTDPLDACQPLTVRKNSDISEFLLSIRGDCDFVTKVRHAQDAGYVAAIIYNNEENDNLIKMSGHTKGTKIFAVFISKEAGEVLYSSSNDTSSRCYLLPTYKNTAESLVFISLMCLLTVLAVFSTLFFVRRHRRHQTNSGFQEREASKMAWEDFRSLRIVLYGGDGFEKFSTCCAICLEDYKQGERLRILPCRHEFHISCIDEWLKNRRCFCPICKMDARLKHSKGSPSEHTPLLASCTHGSSTSISSQNFEQYNQQIQQCSPRFQDENNLRQGAFLRSECDVSSTAPGSHSASH
ncbi:hypothetical protein KP509_35G025600 [Ceratopteris richardii]|nr:hypothetical protein KP509_35G025600 [Ceratopteris richardii]